MAGAEPFTEDVGQFPLWPDLIADPPEVPETLPEPIIAEVLSSSAAQPTAAQPRPRRQRAPRPAYFDPKDVTDQTLAQWEHTVATRDLPEEAREATIRNLYGLWAINALALRNQLLGERAHVEYGGTLRQKDRAESRRRAARAAEEAKRLGVAALLAYARYYGEEANDIQEVSQISINTYNMRFKPRYGDKGKEAQDRRYDERQKLGAVIAQNLGMRLLTAQARKQLPQTRAPRASRRARKVV